MAGWWLFIGRMLVPGCTCLVGGCVLMLKATRVLASVGVDGEFVR
jgi:hypothetical protein